MSEPLHKDYWPADVRIRYGLRSWRERLLSWPWRPWVAARMSMTLCKLVSVEMTLKNNIRRDGPMLRSGRTVDLSVKGEM